jgi:D-3-phosphoglycerate dehydrogenase / 2-oxoglutarate reductase
VKDVRTPVVCVVEGQGSTPVMELRHRLPWARIVACPAAELSRQIVDADVLVPLGAVVDKQVFAAASRLRLVVQWGSGLERVDPVAAADAGVEVVGIRSSDSGSAIAVAEWCVMAAMIVGRDLVTSLRNPFSAQVWGTPVGQTISRSTAVVIGYGAVGRQLARMLRSLDASVLVLRRQVPHDATSEVYPMTRFNQVVQGAQWIFVTARAPANSAPILGPTELDQLEAGTVVINAARGHLVDQTYLEAAVRRGHLKAALDVFQGEPLTGRESVLTAPGLLATPHIAGVTRLTERNIALLVSAEIERRLQP